MPKLEEALYAYLSNDPGVLAALEDEPRIYPVRLPEGTVIPAIAYTRVSADRIYTFDPFELTDAWTRARVQFDCWHPTPDGAMAVGEAVLMALSGFEGDMSGQLIGSSFAVNEIDIYDEKVKQFRRIMDFMIAYEDDLVVSS